jgi:hypothetical protein
MRNTLVKGLKLIVKFVRLLKEGDSMELPSTSGDIFLSELQATT